ncbi:guanylate cyclase [Trinickia violacea]|uniref:Guanylate cyclase n=1 Tax=Trinickia violacea TaxID=2571746 RepID=A0A4P8ILV8_9BURK|nr:AAA family ATPase [Trinickia violacea]QCP47803.1 guanylate cyclase [Trinickia violacea]
MSDDLTKWLVKAGLGAYAQTFAAQGIDWDVLGDLSDADLQALGLTIGDCKRLAKALAGLTRGRAPAVQRDIERLDERTSSLAVQATEAERRQLTVMFIDLIDSTSLAERFDPEDLRDMLHVFHQACAHEIDAHDGHIAQYVGDGLVVYFGYPRAHEDDAVRAVLVGLAVVSALGQVNDRIEAEHGVRLHMRIGIETGLVVAGEVGAGSLLDHQAVVGETPIFAERLQSLAPPDAILVGPATERLIRDSFLLESIGLRALKGIATPVPVYRVLARTDALDRFEIRAGHGMTPLIGRSAELDMIRQRWKQSTDGEMRCVMLIGEPGIGKSRMLRAFTDSIHADVHVIVSLHCSPYYRNSPFWPVLQWVQRAYGLDPKRPDASDLERLESGLGVLGVDVEEMVLVLATLLGIPTGERYAAVDASSPSFKHRTLSGLVTLIERMTHPQPVLVIVEDAHWIDPSSLDLVRLLLEQMVSTRLMVLLTGRPSFRPEWSYPHLVQINLDRLSRRDCAAMIERLTESKPIPRVVLDEIVAKTDGVPLFVEELTKTVVRGGQLHDAGSSYELRSMQRSLAIPDTLQGSLLSQLDRLEPSAKEAAQIAATIGREFDATLLALIASKPESELQRMLDSLVAAEIIVPGPGVPGHSGAYLFRHALIQEIAYQSLLIVRRRDYHGRIALALEQHYPAVVDRQPELVAENFALSDQPARAIAYWQRAGERALARAAYDEAFSHAQRGLQMAESLSAGGRDWADAILPLLLIRGGAEHRLGRRDAIETFRRAAQVARAEKLSSYMVSAALGFVTAEMYLGGTGEVSIALLREALASIGREETLERCRLLSRLAVTLRMTGEVKQSDELAREAVALARRLGDRASLFDALACEVIQVGAQHLPAARFAERQAVLEQLSQLAEELGDAHLIGQACARSLTGYLEIGNLECFESALQRYQQIVTSGKHFVDKWCVTGAQAMRALLVGDFALAERKAQESLDLAESVDAKFAAGVYGMQMFTLRREQGRLAEVAPLVKRFLEEHPEDATWRPGLMLILCDLGFDAQALHRLNQAAEGGFRIAMDSKRLITLTYFAEVAARLHETEHTERIYALLLPFRDQVVTVPAFTLCCGSTARYLGMLAGALGDWPAAEAHFEYALQTDERLRAWPWLAHTRREFAVMLSHRHRNGDLARAADLVAAAAATAKELGMCMLLNRIGGAANGSGAQN